MRWLFQAAILAVAYSFLAMAAPLEEIAPFAEEDYRLPTTILPSNYNITLKPYLLESEGAKRFTFDGEVFITVKSSQAVSQIILHSKTLTYTLREYWSIDTPTNKIPLSLYSQNAVTDKITYTLGQPLDTTKTYVLHFIYSGKMEDDMHGFYRSSYVDSNNNTIWLASTQFETNHARRAFPSFDEPKFKATFDVTIERHKSMNTHTGTPLKTSTVNGNYFSDTFERTPKMSTYILAFIVSGFGHRTDGDFGIIARQEYYDQSEYSFNVGKKLLAAFDDYFNIKYNTLGVNKMDMAAIPDFSAGAMENWGLLTYRERNLLYVEDSTTLSAQQSIAAVIAHEQAHMWFGDLVTCDWWSYTWLNEGFARYFQYFGTAWVEKHMLVDQQFVPDQLQSVMGMDSTNGTNPMSDENTNSPADLSRMFNSISYNKGAVFIRMVNHIIGETNFRASLTEYLNQYKYQNTIPKNLFDVWKKYFPTTFASYADAFFESYTKQVGYPVVSVELAADGKSFQLSQKRFLLKKDDTNSNASLLYTVPITYTTNSAADFNSTVPKLFLPATTNKVKVDLTTNATWLILNVQEGGYYRVNYTESNWHAIHHALLKNNWDNIHELNRAQIVDDLLNLARAGVLSYNLALDILEYLSTETHYLPWTSAFNGLNYLSIRLGTNLEHFSIYIRSLTEKVYSKLGFEQKTSDSSLDIYLRAKVLSWSCKYGNSECTSKALDLFKTLETKPVPVNIRSAVYCSAMRNGDTSDYEKLLTKYKKEKVATEQTLILSALGCVKKSDLVKKQYNVIVSDDVRRQDKSSALTSLYTENNENVSPVFKLVTDNYKQLADVMGGYSAVASVISGISSRFTTEAQQKDLEAFNKANASDFGSSAATLTAAEKSVQENLKWSEENLGVFTDFLSKRGSGASSVNAFAMLTLLMTTLVAYFLR